MPVTRWAISLEKELAKRIKRSAAREPISAWIADAARRKLRSEGLLDAVTTWEKDSGHTISEAASADAWAEFQKAVARHRVSRRKRRH
jgi:hypothetical protein